MEGRKPSTISEDPGIRRIREPRRANPKHDLLVLCVKAAVLAIT